MGKTSHYVKAVKTRYIGISFWYTWQLAKANVLAVSEGYSRFISIQGHYNLMFQGEEREIVGLCADDNIKYDPIQCL